MTDVPANPSFDCLPTGHLVVFTVTDRVGRLGSWCAWCGGAVHDPNLDEADVEARYGTYHMSPPPEQRRGER